MIPFIRILSGLMAITESREGKKNLSRNNEGYSSKTDIGQKKGYKRSIDKKEVSLPGLPSTIRHNWKQKKADISRFIDQLDYNNQIQPSYDLTLLERQNKRNQQDVA